MYSLIYRCIHFIKKTATRIKYTLYVKLYLKWKLDLLYKKFKNSNDEFNESLNIQMWYCLHLTKEDFKLYLKDLAARRQFMHLQSL